MISKAMRYAAIEHGVREERQDMTKKADGYGAIDFLAGAAVGGGLGALAGELAERSAKKKVVEVLQKAINNINNKGVRKGAYMVGIPLALAGGLYAKSLGNSRRSELRMRRRYQ